MTSTTASSFIDSVGGATKVSSAGMIDIYNQKNSIT
jgi:hypothetical protein